jgi:glucose/arabinose dehydrogenase
MRQHTPLLLSILSLSLFVTAPARAATAQLPATNPADLPRIRLERLPFKLDRPVYGLHDPAGRFFFVEQPGRVRLYEDGKLDETAYLDITSKVLVNYECGLLSIAFHPKFEQNGLLYLDYNIKEGSQIKSVISELHVDPKSKHADTSSERVLFTVDQPYENHKGGQLQFGPDGYLYIGFGDGGNMHDPHNNGQNPNLLLGKILRIDVTPRQGYGIPKDNPFAGREGWRPEIWTLGMRNPWRFCFDRETGLLYAADVGQDTWEEVDIIEKGGNYGWRIREGAHDHQPVPHPPATIDPIFEYNHNKAAASITGGYVYRGKQIPALRGWYLFGDYSHGTIYGLKYENGRVTTSGLLIDPLDPKHNGGQRPTQPSAFAEDADGELFMCDANGPVYRVVGEK